MKYFELRVETLKSGDFAQQRDVVRRKVEVHLQLLSASQFGELLISDTLQEGLADVGCADVPAASGCF